ncbi:MAG TPA: TIGR02186 family protein, partial [Allosphingosinicella sp.]
MMRAALALLLALLLGSAARAERLIVSVSNHRVTVTPNYSGEELVLFGSVERDAGAEPGRRQDRDGAPSLAREPGPGAPADEGRTERGVRHHGGRIA